MVVDAVASFLDGLVFEATFTSTGFLVLLLPLTLGGYWAVPRVRWKHAWLVLMSLVFYSLWDARFVALLLACALWDFLIAHRIAVSEGAARRRWLGASVALNLGALGFFKYAMFGAETARSLLSLLGVPGELPYFHVVLPVGISFYVFQTLSYAIDVYRREVTPTRDLLKYLAFVSLFPQLVAGPIVRYKEMDAQLDKLPRALPPGMLMLGVGMLAFGMFKKLALADPLAPHVDAAWAAEQMTMTRAWIAAAGHTAQIYLDFSGYSDMAIGLGALLGFTFPENFRAPFHARDPRDHWRRWHVTLSRFLRDYVYHPRGGNRKGEGRTYVNLFLVMLLCGLWHGAAWTFVLWGAYHGALLLLHRATRDAWARMHEGLQRGLTLLLIVLGFVLFRAVDLGGAARVYAHLLDWGSLAVGQELFVLAVVLGLLLALATLPRRLAWRTLHTRRDGVLVGALLVLVLMALLSGGESPYLYYQF